MTSYISLQDNIQVLKTTINVHFSNKCFIYIIKIHKFDAYHTLRHYYYGISDKFEDYSYGHQV